MRFLIPLLLIVVPLSACAPQPSAAPINNESVPSAEAEPLPAVSREALYCYGGQRPAEAQIILELAGEPVLLPSGYLRLVGVVSGVRPVACVESGGRGLALAKGEMIDDYRVTGIVDDRVVLERGK